MDNIITWHLCAAIFAFLIGSSVAVGEDEHDHRAHMHHVHGASDAPTGVMGDHAHEAGEWMLSYRYMFMLMDGNRGRGGRKSTGDVLANFPVAPTEMFMEMHMFGVMLAAWTPAKILSSAPPTPARG